MVYEPQMVKPVYDTDTVLNFGKHKGTILRDLDGDYLLWMIYNLTNAEFTDEVYDLAQEYAENFYGDGCPVSARG